MSRLETFRPGYDDLCGVNGSGSKWLSGLDFRLNRATDGNDKVKEHKGVHSMEPGRRWGTCKTSQ